MNKFALVPALLLLMAGGAVAQSSSGAVGRQQPLSDKDKQFLDFAAQDNQAEIQLCLYAEKKARSPAIKAFARLMVDDHVAVESRLASLINGVGVDVPTGVGREGEETFSQLREKSGSAFDDAFMEAQIKDHGHDIEKFDDEVKDTGNDGVRRFGSETVEILKQHLALARAVKANVER